MTERLLFGIKAQRIEYVPQKGELLLADFATLRSSTLLPSAGLRVSIDTSFALERSRNPGEAEKIHPWRADERASHDLLNGLGQSGGSGGDSTGPRALDIFCLLASALPRPAHRSDSARLRVEVRSRQAVVRVAYYPSEDPFRSAALLKQ